MQQPAACEQVRFSTGIAAAFECRDRIIKRFALRPRKGGALRRIRVCCAKVRIDALDREIAAEKDSGNAVEVFAAFAQTMHAGVQLQVYAIALARGIQQRRIGGVAGGHMDRGGFERILFLVVEKSAGQLDLIRLAIRFPDIAFAKCRAVC